MSLGTGLEVSEAEAWSVDQVLLREDPDVELSASPVTMSACISPMMIME